jgi:16S rRNA processing protein RimM
MDNYQQSGAPSQPDRATLDRLAPWAWLARLHKPQGRKGEIFAELLTDFPDKFAERKKLWLLPDEVSGHRPRASSHVYPRLVTLKHHWRHKGGIVLHFDGIDSISTAEELNGLIVAIPGSERAPLSEDETYVGDLIGCALVDVAGTEPVLVGTICDVDRSAGPTPLLVLDCSNGEVLIPFAKSYLRRLDLDTRRVEMTLPEGLIDLNT